jgi:peptide/nickel transport system permease protein
MNLKANFRTLLQYPSAIAGLIVITFLLAISVYAVVTIPYSEAIRLWRGGDDVWRAYPRNAPPAWVNYFSSVKKANTIIMDSADPGC